MLSAVFAAGGLNVEQLYQVQLLKQDVAAGVGRRLADGIAVVGGGDRLLPSRAAISQVSHGEKTALFLAEVDDGLRDLAAVEGVSASFDDGLEGAGQVLLIEDFPWTQGPAISGEDSTGSGKLAEQPVSGYGFSQVMGHREAVLRQVQGRAENLGQGEAAVLLVGVQPAMNQAGHGHGQDALHWYAAIQVSLPGGGVGRGAGAVGDLNPVGLFPVDHDEPVAADTRHQWLHNV